MGRLDDAVNLDDYSKLVDSDYDISIEVGDDDRLFEDFVNDIVTDRPPTKSDEIEDGSSGFIGGGGGDVLDNDYDLDENKLSNDEQAKPSYQIFNPVEIFDPTFLLGMLFSTKDEF
ncbi:hypothetical protein Salat_1858200 [Sesamum alatum]|uniref:Uncharacterized protein n=1 Tax=Sesamum alatum TaxID=300844 RepID=A0AAE1Y3U1_9LAMI|nr:hypothetical protein Salat_1858200 [Sesamum alatum]